MSSTQSDATPNIASLRPALANVREACRYLGDPSRAKFYADILPKLEVVKLGARTMVTLDSLDKYIVANTRARGAV